MKRAATGFVACLMLGACAGSPRSVRPRPSPSAELARQGDVLRRRGRGEEALDAYRRALAVDAGNVRAHVGVQVIRLGRGEDLALRREYRAGGERFLAGRLEGDRERREEAYEAATEPWRSIGLGEAAAGESRPAARYLYRRARAIDPGNPAARSGLGAVALAAGNLGLAEAELMAALWSDPQHPGPPWGLSRIADRRGDLAGAFEWALEAFRRAPAEPMLAARATQLAERSGRKEWKALAAAVLAEGDDPEVLARAGSLLSGGGSEEAALEVWERAVAKGLRAEEIAAYRRSGVPPRLTRFVDAFVAGVEARYRHYAGSGEAESFDDFVAWARRLYEESTDGKLGPRGRTLKFAFVGKLIDPTTRSDEPLVRACAGEGLLLVLGQRRGGPPEALLAAVEAREPRKTVRTRGMEVEREAVWIGERHLSGYLEWAGAGDIAGLALEKIVIVDLHAAATWEGSLLRDRARLEPRREEILVAPALEDRSVTSVGDPAGVDRRLLLCGPIDVAGEVLAHEDAHLVDAALHLPVTSHPLRNLGLALSRGFQADEILAYLERNAQVAAIAEGPTPLASLAVCCAALGGTGAHASGYTEIVEGIVREIRVHSERYPEIDLERVIVQQLHRLSEDQVRAAAAALMQRWGIVAD